MDEEDYEQEFEQEDPQESEVTVKADQKAPPVVPRGKIHSERKLSGHPIIRVLRDLSQEKSKNHWSSQSSKLVSVPHVESQAPIDEEPSHGMNEQQLKRSIYQLQIRIKSMEKSLQQQQEEFEREEIEEVKATQHSGQTETTIKIRKRAFNREEQVKYLIARRYDLHEELVVQHNKILSLKNREMELQSAQYLFDLAKQVEHHQLYLKKLGRYVHQQRLNVEKGVEVPIRHVKRVGHSDKSVQGMLLHTEISIEKLHERSSDLDDKITDLQENNKYLDQRLAELYKEYEQEPQEQPSPERLYYKEMLHRRLTDEKNLKTIKASIRNKLLVAHSENDQLIKQNRQLDRDIAEQRLASQKMLERLKQQTEHVENDEVLNLADYLIAKLEKSEALGQKSQDLANSRVSTIDRDQTFTSGIIRLKRRLAISRSRRQQPSFGQMYAADSSHMITQFPSLNTTKKSHQNSPRTTRRRTSSQLSVTTNDEQQHSNKLVRFSYW